MAIRLAPLVRSRPATVRRPSPWDDRDPLAAARGGLFGVAVGSALWAALVAAGVWLVRALVSGLPDQVHGGGGVALLRAGCRHPALRRVVLVVEEG